MTSAGFCSLLNTALATLPPIKPREVCISPVSFQWRARQSRSCLYSAITKLRNEGLSVNIVGKRQFSRGLDLTKDLRASSEASFVRLCLSNDGPAEKEDKWHKEQKHNAALDTQDAAIEEPPIFDAILSEQVSRELSMSTVGFEDKGTGNTVTHSSASGASTSTYRPCLSAFSTKSGTFRYIWRDHGVFKNSVMDRHVAFSTTTTSAMEISRDEEKIKRELETAEVQITNDGEQDALPPRLYPSTVVKGSASVDRVEISAQVRKAMRCVPQPVYILTSTDMSAGTPVFRGATISSFNTVTIEPTTIVSLNIKTPSSTFNAIESSGYFIAHLLKADQTSSDLAQAFTKGSSTDPFRMLNKVSQVKLPEISGQAATADDGPPLIEDCPSPGRLLCRYLPQKTVSLGDHVVIFGTVDGSTKNQNEDEASQLTCLIYANGQYGCINPLKLSSTPKISSIAFDDFVCKLKLMDHSILHTISIPSNDYVHLRPSELKTSFGILRSQSRALFEFLRNDEALNSKSRLLSIDSKTRAVSSLSDGIFKAVTFYDIFLTSMRGADFTTFEVPHLPLEASKALQTYQMVIRETYEDIASIRGTLQKLHNPWTTYQPPASDIYSLDQSLSETLGENLHYLDRYIRCCLPPLARLETATVATPVLQRLFTQYNATLRALYRMYHKSLYNYAHHSDYASATRLGHRLLWSKVHTTAKPLIRVHYTNKPLVREYLAKDLPLVKKYMRQDAPRLARRVPVTPVARKIAIKSTSQYKSAEDQVKVKFMDPYARFMDEAEQQEDAIRRGLQDIERLMAGEGGDRRS